MTKGYEAWKEVSLSRFVQNRAYSDSIILQNIKFTTYVAQFYKLQPLNHLMPCPLPNTWLSYMSSKMASTTCHNLDAKIQKKSIAFYLQKLNIFLEYIIERDQKI